MVFDAEREYELRYENSFLRIVVTVTVNGDAEEGIQSLLKELDERIKDYYHSRWSSLYDTKS